MFARVAAFTLLALPIFAAANPLARRGDSCSTGPVQCCNSVHEKNEAAISTLLGLVGLDVGSITGTVGLQCSPLSVVGAGGGNCKSNAVCCQNNNVGGLISVGCAPIFL